MMRNRGKGISRRAFLQGVATGAAGLPMLAQATRAQPEQKTEVKSNGQSRVILIRDRDVLNENNKLNVDVLTRMFDRAVTALLDQPTPLDAWKQLFKATDTVGIKTNVWRFLHTPESLEQTMRQYLIDVGVAPERIAIDDRSVLRNPVFQKATALINVRPMRTHHWAGVGSLIKNYIMFSPSPPSWHDDSCANLAGVWDLPVVKGKTRLCVLVMLTPLFHGKGPHHYQKEYQWAYKGLLVGLDPVAVDATGLRIIQARRKEYFGQDTPLPISPKHIQVAQDKYKLGMADPDRIELVRLGWMEEALI